MNACRRTFNGSDFISNYYWGRSIAILPFTPFGFWAIFLSGLALHLINYFLTIKLLKKIQGPWWGALFYLLYPAFAWSSRTLYPELMVSAFLLGGLYCYLSEKKIHHALCGVLFGFAVLTRYDALIAVAAFGLVAAWKNPNKAKFMLLGFAPVALLIGGINTVLYGGAFKSSYGNPVEIVSRSLNPDLALSFIIYAVLLATLYPLLSIAPAISKKPGSKEVLAALIAQAILFSQFTSFFAVPFDIKLLWTVRLRYLIPVISIAMVFLPDLYQHILDKWVPKKSGHVIAAGFISLFLLYGALSFTHQQFLESRYQTFQAIYDNTPKNALVVGSSDDCMYFMKGPFEERRYIRIDPKNDLGRSFDQNAESFFDGNTYVIQLNYANTIGRNGIRQDTIDRERKQIEDFIEQNQAHLTKVFSAEKPNPITLYRWNP